MQGEKQKNLELKLTDQKAVIRKTTILVSIFLIGQYIVGLAAKAFYISVNYEMKLNWVGIILGWGSLICGFSFRKKLVGFRSKLIGNLYLVSGVVLLFIGSTIGGWVLALGHQLYGFYYYKSTKYVILQWLLWFVGYLLLGFLLGITLTATGINVFAK